MVIVIVNKSRRSMVSIFLTMAMQHAPMISMFLNLKTPLIIKMSQDETTVNQDEAGIVIDDDGRFVTARAMWPVER